LQRYIATYIRSHIAEAQGYQKDSQCFTFYEADPGETMLFDLCCRVCCG
jgi:hypothetical protein